MKHKHVIWQSFVYHASTQCLVTIIKNCIEHHQRALHLNSACGDMLLAYETEQPLAFSY